MSISQKGIDAIDLDHVSWHTDKKILEDSYYLVKHFPDYSGSTELLPRKL